MKQTFATIQAYLRIQAELIRLTCTSGPTIMQLPALLEELRHNAQYLNKLKRAGYGLENPVGFNFPKM